MKFVFKINSRKVWITLIDYLIQKRMQMICLKSLRKMNSQRRRKSVQINTRDKEKIKMKTLNKNLNLKKVKSRIKK